MITISDLTPAPISDTTAGTPTRSPSRVRAMLSAGTTTNAGGGASDED